jgi:RNA polymerase sigma factor (sigma-70 family)
MSLPVLDLWFKAQDDLSLDDTRLRSRETVHLAAGHDSAALVDAIRRGDERAFEIVFRAHTPELVRYATGLVRVRGFAEEVVQETFLGIWERRASLIVRGGVRPFLYGAVRHRCVDLIRRDRALARAQAIPFDLPPMRLASDRAEHAELDHRVRSALGALSPRVREVITLRLRDELTYAEIAVLLGTSLKTVEAQMANALRHLRSELADLRMDA